MAITKTCTRYFALESSKPFNICFLLTGKTGDRTCPKLCIYIKNKILKRIPTTWCDYLCTSSPIKEQSGQQFKVCNVWKTCQSSKGKKCEILNLKLGNGPNFLEKEFLMGIMEVTIITLKLDVGFVVLCFVDGPS